MTMTIDLTPELEMQLRDEAAKEGMDPNGFVLSAVEERLHQKRLEQSVPHLSKAESELMRKINAGLPVETWQQYRKLRARCQAETLTPEEHQSLIELSDQVEMDYAQRLGFVLELSRLHGISLEEQMKVLGIPQYSYE